MKGRILMLFLGVALTGWAEEDEVVYGVYSLPNYNVDPAGGDRPAAEWGFSQARVRDGDGSPTEAVTLAHALVTLPAVDMSRRGAATLDPVIRGLGGDRVATFFNGLRLPGGSPTNLAPVNLFFPGAAASVSVTRAFPSVATGQLTTGGRIDLGSPRTAERSSARTAVRVSSGWEGFSLSGSGLAETKGTKRFTGAVSAAGFDDYRTGGDDWVDADFRMAGVAGSVGWTESDGRVTDLALVVNHQFLTRNASLPLDLKDTTMVILTAETAWEAGRVTWSARAGYADTRPFLTSEDRPVAPGAPIRLVTAKGEARSLGVRISGTMPWGEMLEVEGGFDLGRQTRDSVRIRSMTTGTEFADHIWPEIETTNLGAFAEIRWEEPDRFRLIGGMRVDRSWSDALAADDPVLGLPGARGTTIRENYAAYNGPDAGVTNRDDWSGAAQLSAEVPIAIGLEGLTGFAGIGLVRATPGETERYRAFLNALGGGMELGNPSLGCETRYEIDAGLRIETEGLRLVFSGFLARVDDFIQREAIAADPTVYGFRNRDVELAGFELTSEWTPAWLERVGMSVDGSLSVVGAENRADSTGLPEIPPWTLRAGLSWMNRREAPSIILRMETKMVGSQTNPNPEALPLYRDTGAFGLWSVGGWLDFGGGWAGEVVIENLFDRRYFDYLQAPVADGVLGPSSGTLGPGDPIPGMGRRVTVAVRKSF